MKYREPSWHWPEVKPKKRKAKRKPTEPRVCRHPRDEVYILGLSVEWCPCGAIRWARKTPGVLGRWRRPKVSK